MVGELQAKTPGVQEGGSGLGEAEGRVDDVVRVVRVVGGAWEVVKVVVVLGGDEGEIVLWVMVWDDAGRSVEGDRVGDVAVTKVEGAVSTKVEEVAERLHGK